MSNSDGIHFIIMLSRIEIPCQLMSLHYVIFSKYSVVWQLFAISCHVDNVEITNRNRSLIFCFQSQCDKQPRDFQVWPYSWNLIACKYNKDDIILLLVTVPKECFIMQGDLFLVVTEHLIDNCFRSRNSLELAILPPNIIHQYAGTLSWMICK